MTSDRAASRFPGHRAMLCSFVTLVMGMAAQATDEIVESDEIFKSRGKEFAVDVFAPRAPGKYPAIIALHGHGGPGEDKRSWSHDLVRRLRARLRRAGAPLFRPSQAGSQEWPKKRTVLLRLDADGQRCDQLRRAGLTSTGSGSGWRARRWDRGSRCRWRRGIGGFPQWWNTTAGCRNGKSST